MSSLENLVESQKPMPEREGIDTFGPGQFNPMEGEDLDPEELEKANRRLREKRSGKKPNGTFEIDPDNAVPNEDTKETATS